jgi:hypothetical protein
MPWKQNPRTAVAVAVAAAAAVAVEVEAVVRVWELVWALA